MKKQRQGLREWRAARGLSLRQAASQFGITHSCWNKIELGQTAPRKALAKRLIEGTGVALDVLMGIAS